MVREASLLRFSAKRLKKPGTLTEAIGERNGMQLWGDSDGTDIAEYAIIVAVLLVVLLGIRHLATH